MNRIAELRKSRGISQIALAKELGIAQNTLSQYENELRNPTVNIITKVANFFGVSTNYVLGFPDQSKDNSTQDYSLDKVSEIITFDSRVNGSIQEVNLHLELGWKLLHIGTESEIDYDSSGYSSVIYTLGWYGEPGSAKHVHTEAPGEEYSNWL